MVDADALMEHSFSSPVPSIIDSSDEMSTDDIGIQWLTKLTRSIKDNIPSVIDGVACTIHRSARNLVNEFSEMENEARRDRSENHDTTFYDGAESDVTILPLPWELRMETNDGNSNNSIVSQEDSVLKEKVMALSLDEAIFTTPFNGETKRSESISFALDEPRVMLIRQLLEIDQNLGHIHARLSGRSEVKETIFWKNYFYHCEELRATREKEIEEADLRRSFYDDELDAELVDHPPVSCTGFYPRTGNLQASVSDVEERTSLTTTPEIDTFVLVNDDSIEY